MATVSWASAFFALEAAGSSPDWTSILLSSGVAGVVVLLFVLDKITTTSERDRLRQIVDKVIADTLPATQEANRLMKEFTDRIEPLVRDLLEGLKEVERERGRRNRGD